MASGPSAYKLVRAEPAVIPAEVSNAAFT